MKLFQCGDRTLDENDLDWISAQVKKGGVIVYPTETLYGIGCDPCNKNAVEQLFELKARPLAGDVSIAFHSIEQVEEWVTLAPPAKDMLERYTPGPFTLLVPRPKELGLALPPGELFGIRIPSHPVAKQLIRETGPLISTSANQHGTPPSTEEAKRIGEGCDATILASGIDGLASTIVKMRWDHNLENCSTKILRKGVLDIEL